MLRRRQPTAERSFRLRGGLLIPIATIVIFGLLGILASIGIGSTSIIIGTPLIVTLVIFLLSALYVYLYIPRLRVAAAARRATTTRRRPPKIQDFP
jgi:hypothetical protein